ncbi:hypothetical protein LPJ61_001150 [Coemansia biformis]|uniref:PABS domain-containing protein n=1 Tax=Coemansia biformis TaxID=1286918 RepID=A0A9W7YGJ2_9FUNG|nr:hypothetical protein LPJ61_001150 [Coemansia biformis]
MDGVAGPPGPILAAIVIGFTSTTILTSSLIRLGPQSLEPVYGNVLPYLGFFHGLVVSLVLGGVIGARYWRHAIAAQSPAAAGARAGRLTIDVKTARAVAMAFDIAALLTALAPLRVTYMFRWSDRLGPMWGALATQCMLAFPVFALGGFVATVGALRLAYNPRSPARQGTMLAACLGAIAILIWVGQRFSSAHGSCHGLLINAGYAALSSVMVKLLAGHQEDVDAADAIAAASEQRGVDSRDNAGAQLALLRDRQLRKLRFLPAVGSVFFALTTLFADPTCTSGLRAGGDAGTPGYQMLYRNESITGWVSVSDEAERGIRLLRSGHSLIGAHWKATSESTFGIFYYADAVRLIKGRKHNPEDRRRASLPAGGGRLRALTRKDLAGDGTERALQIGLGVGVSARSLHRQNVRVDVVEIDPAVHEAAVRFFGLPRNLNAVHLMDGRRFIDQAPAAIYDYIVHDVFTGGSVPAALFSQSAVGQLRRILRRDGVLAMNYVGIPNDKRTLGHIVSTLRTAFPSVRCFAETLADLDTTVNMMFFASAEPIAFDITPDVLQVIGMDTIRGAMLSEMLGHELDLAVMGDFPGARPITDDWNPLPGWQVPTAAEHWRTMRKLFPTSYWLNY